MADKKVRCKICGAIFEEGPETCPVCGVPKALFEPAPVEEPKAEEKAEEAPASDKPQVRCKICGAVFEEGPETCPVCGMPKSLFEPVASAKQGKSNDDGAAVKIVVIGGGIAAVTAAEAARTKNKNASVIIISEEAELPYNRPMLTKNSAAVMEENPFPIYAASFYSEKNIELIQGKKVSAIDKSAKKVICADDAEFSYDKLILATGASCFVPPFKGVEKKGVIAIRSVADARKLAEYLADAESAVVIGGGVLGLEAAWSIAGKVKNIAVLEVANKLFAGKISAQTSDALQEKIEAKGIDIITEAQTAEICGEERVSSVKLADGREYPAQVVIVSTGVRANVALAESIGIKCERGIVVDAKMQTSEADIYACGDCAVYEGVNFALWEEALEQAKVAGANAAGGEGSYALLNPAIIMNAFETSLFVFGATEKDGCTTVAKTVDQNGIPTLKTYYLRDGRLCGITSLGDIIDISNMREIVEQKAQEHELEL